MNTSKATRIRNMYRSPTLLAALLALAALLGAAPAVVADCECKPLWIIGPDESCVLEEDCEVELLIILPNGRLYTANHTLTITGSIGLIMVSDTLSNPPSYSWLYIQAGGTVVLSGGGTSYVDGHIVLEAHSSVFRIADSDHTITYIRTAGNIIGEDNSARIEIGDGLTLTSEITIEGALVIDEPSGSATFINGTGGLVHANRTSGTLALSVAALDDGVNTVPGNWQVSASNAELEFNVGSTCLTGTFTVSNGTLDVNATVCTTGSLSFTGGTIDVAPSTTFSAGGSCTCE